MSTCSSSHLFTLHSLHPDGFGVKIVLISTYELGRQPFGLASPAAWLRRAGAEVYSVDTSVQQLPTALVRQADLLAFYLPMYTATRKALRMLESVRAINLRAPLCFYGLYAPMNAEHLRTLGADAILGGEFETGLVQWMKEWAAVQSDGIPPESPTVNISLDRQQFIAPERNDLPPLKRYAQLNLPCGKQRIVGYTEASRGCKHLCRHCPVVPVYKGHFRIVQQEVVFTDIARQVEMGAQHITFGDPDFFNGVGHALAVIHGLHQQHPHLSYDVTIKIEHLLKYSRHLPKLRDTGCLFVTSAVESIDDSLLRRLDKGHTRQDFLTVLQHCRDAGLALSPTFIPFTPWSSLESYQELLDLLVEEDLIENVAPIQLAIRLLIPAQSRLLELPELRQWVSEFDKQGLSYRWNHPDARMDALQQRLLRFINDAACRGLTRQEIFAGIWDRAHDDLPAREPPESVPRISRAAIPYLTEPWYC
jgi:radical SAM superfamily enzyme YgiQ (UPF0313 family)